MQVFWIMNLWNFLDVLQLTVSHLAFIFSFSNLANSLLSWIIIKSFQISSNARPIRTIPATTPSLLSLLAHKSPIAGWIVAESDSEIILRTVVGIYPCDWEGATEELDGARSVNVMQSQWEPWPTPRGALELEWSFRFLGAEPDGQVFKLHSD